MVPRAWTHLLGIVAGRDIDPSTSMPEDWIALAAKARPDIQPPGGMTDGNPGLVAYERWDGTVDMAVDRAIQDTRNRIYPLHGLDPHDPRD